MAGVRSEKIQQIWLIDWIFWILKGAMNVGSDGDDFGILGIFGSFTFRYGMNHQNLGSGS